MENILITGGDGFIGSHLADELIKNNKLGLLDIKFSENSEHLDCKKTIGNVTNYDDVEKAVKDKDAIFHFAAVSRVEWGQEDPVKCLRTNSLGTLNVLEAVRKNNPKAIIFLASSREVYGEPKELPVKETHPKNPISIYGISKVAGENLALSYKKYFGLKVVILRFSNVYGTKRDLVQRVIPKFILQALSGQTLMLNGGDQILDFTFIEDTINGVLSAYNQTLNGNVIGEDFHFLTGKGASIKELANMIIGLCNSDSQVKILSPKDYDVHKFVGTYEKANKILNWKPKYSLKQGLQKTVKSFGSSK